MKRILVGIDGSEPSNRAVELAAQLALPAKALVTVAHVVNPSTYPLQGYPSELINPVAEAELVRQGQRLGESLTASAAERLRALGVAAETQVLTGNPPLELAGAAERGGYDIVAIGSTGKGAVKRMLLGSTSDRLVRLCTRPVLVVH